MTTSNRRLVSKHETTCPVCVRYGDAGTHGIINHYSDGTYESDCSHYTGAHRQVGDWPTSLVTQFAIDPHHPGLHLKLLSQKRSQG
jgi:hypothetical protein